MRLVAQAVGGLPVGPVNVADNVPMVRCGYRGLVRQESDQDGFDGEG